MTLLHTRGYIDVLEAVKKRAEKKALAMARQEVTLALGTLLKQLYQLTLTHVLLAADEVEAAQPGVSYNAFTDEEDETIRLTFAEDVLRHYRRELAVVRQENAAREEQAEIEKDGACTATCIFHSRRACEVNHNDMSKSAPLPAHLCRECF